MTSEDKDIGAAARRTEATGLTDRMKATAADLTDRTKGTAADLTDRTKGTAADLTDRTKGTAADLTDRTKGTAADLTDRTKGTAADLTDRTKGTAADLTDRTKGTAADLTDRTKGTAADLTDRTKGTAADLTDRTKGTAADLTDRTKGTAADLTDRTKGTAADLTDRTRTVMVKRMPRREKPVDLSTLPAEAKLLYCRILTHQAKSDHVLDPREISNLYLFASTIGLDADARLVLRREVAAAPPAADDADVRNEDDVALTARLSDLLDGPERDAVMTMLVKDLLSVSRADGQFTDEERARIEAIAAVIFPENADAVIHETERLLESEEALAASKITTSEFEKRTKDSVAAAAGLGIPLAAVEIAGAGSGAAALTSSLATLGFGGLLGFSAMATGIGTVVVAGVVAYQGTRFVLGVNERERKKRHEFLVQQVIKNHQQAIADLADDIGDLASRMDDYQELASGNEDRLALLKADLSSFELALADLQSRGALARGPGTGP